MAMPIMNQSISSCRRSRLLSRDLVRDEAMTSLLDFLLNLFFID